MSRNNFLNSNLKNFNLKAQEFLDLNLGDFIVTCNYQKQTWGNQQFCKSTKKTSDYSNYYFDIASLTKPIIATIILEFEKENKLKLNDKAFFYLDFLEDFKELSIENLLCHQSFLQIKNKFSKNATYLPKEMEQILFTRGNITIQKEQNDFQYSDLNYLFLGKILEKIQNKSLDKVVNDFLKKYKIKEISFYPTGKILKTEKELKKGEVNDFKARILKYPTGHAGLFATINGLQKFIETWLNNDFDFEKEIYSQAFYQKNKSANLTNSVYGLVWRTGRVSLFPNHSGFTGPTIILDPQNKQAFIHANNYIWVKLNPQKRDLFLNWNKFYDKN
jgi:CubicO group peptidase (beta-lactamase class C family)